MFEFKDVTLGYENKIVAKDLNFSVNSGEYLCIVGENGTGKSTLLKTMLGLIKPIHGKVEVNIPGKGVGYLPQQTKVQKDFPASVWEVVLSGVLNGKHRNPFYTKADKECAINNMKKLGILDLKKRCYRELSGGQQQRTLLARALCATDSILILDEPVTGLDPKVTAHFYQMTKALNSESVSVIMVSHDIQAVSYASHILHVDKKHPFYGTKEEYMRSSQWKLFQAEADYYENEDTKGGITA